LKYEIYRKGTSTRFAEGIEYIIIRRGRKEMSYVLENGQPLEAAPYYNGR